MRSRKLKSTNWINISCQSSVFELPPSQNNVLPVFDLSAWWWYLNACLPSALTHSLMVGYRATIWQSWMLIKLKVATKRGAQQCFTRLGLRNEGNPDTRSHGNFAVHAANSWAVISWVCSQIGNERCLTEYHQCCLQWNFCLKIPGPFKLILSTNPAQNDGSRLRAVFYQSSTWTLFCCL